VNIAKFGDQLTPSKEIIMKTSMLGFSAVMALTCFGISLPAVADTITGPRGATATGNRTVIQNPAGGYTGGRQGSATGVNGGSVSGQGGFRTNGQGSAVYGRSGTVTSPNGKTYDATTKGNATYNPNSGYSGSRTTTLNGKTYSTSTQNRTTTVVTPSGSRTIVYPARSNPSQP
jgi:hypothetical protein